MASRRKRQKNEEGGEYSDLMVLADDTGFYLGTLCHRADGSVVVGTRESMESWASPEEAEAALQSGRWTQLEENGLTDSFFGQPDKVMVPGDDQLH